MLRDEALERDNIMNGCVSDAAVVAVVVVAVVVMSLHPVVIICGRVLQSTITLFAVSDLFCSRHV